MIWQADKETQILSVFIAEVTHLVNNNDKQDAMYSREDMQVQITYKVNLNFFINYYRFIIDQCTNLSLICA